MSPPDTNEQQKLVLPSSPSSLTTLEETTQGFLLSVDLLIADAESDAESDAEWDIEVDFAADVEPDTESDKESTEQTKGMDTRVVSTAYMPTSVTHSCIGNFTSPQDRNLIITTCTRIEIHLLTASGIKPMLDVPIYGRIATLALFRPHGKSQDFLFIATESCKLYVLQWDGEASTLITRAMGDVSDHIDRPTINRKIAIADPDGRLIGLHLYYGLITVILFDNKLQLTEWCNIRLEEFQVLDIRFLYGCLKPTIVVLYQDYKNARHIKTYEFALKDKDFIKGHWSLNGLSNEASLLIPVPLPFGGVIVIGEFAISYCSATAFKTIFFSSSIVRAYAEVDGFRYLLSDNAGLLQLLVIKHERERETGLEIKHLGMTCVASTISYLDTEVVYVGSSDGDSQLLKVNMQPDAKGSLVEVLERYVSLGLIVDYCAIDLERQDQGQVVTCSGAYRHGALCIVQHGRGFNELASIELNGITGFWSLRSLTDGVDETLLLVSSLYRTCILKVNPQGVWVHAKMEGIVTDEQTLFCHNAVHDQLVQVTPSCVLLISSTSGELLDRWSYPSLITVATANTVQVPYLLCALGDGRMFNFHLNIETGEFSDQKNVSLGTQPISLCTFSSKGTTYVFAASDRPTVIYSRNKKLFYSDVNLKEVSHVCPFNSVAFPDSLAIAKKGKLSIGIVDDIQKNHIHSIPRGEHVQHIFHQKQSRIAICSLKNFLMSTEETMIHFVRLLDDLTFEFISTCPLDTYEYGCSILSCSFTDDSNVYYCVGTTYVFPEDNEPTVGRILVFIVEDGKPRLIVQRKTNGAVNSLNASNGKLLAAVNHKIQLFKWMLRGDGSHELQPEFSNHVHMLELDVQSRSDCVLVGDPMKPIFMLLVKHEETSIKRQIGDGYANSMITAKVLEDIYYGDVEDIYYGDVKNIYHGADNNIGLFSALKKSRGAIDALYGLEVIMGYQLGKFVNQLQCGSLVSCLPDSEVGNSRRVILGPSNGMIGNVLSIPSSLYLCTRRRESMILFFGTFC